MPNPPWLPAVVIYYAFMTTATFLAYAIDKRAAQRASRRISERSLSLWAWCGGFAGAIAGQLLLRHKTRHPSVIALAWLALLAHAAAWFLILRRGV
jgi:uncharacterized membrane protein YsdA (DUF1294 family)